MKYKHVEDKFNRLAISYLNAHHEARRIERELAAANQFIEEQERQGYSQEILGWERWQGEIRLEIEEIARELWPSPPGESEESITRSEALSRLEKLESEYLSTRKSLDIHRQLAILEANRTDDPFESFDLCLRIKAKLGQILYEADGLAAEFDLASPPGFAD
jgi:hypothetical protein